MHRQTKSIFFLLLIAWPASTCMAQTAEEKQSETKPNAIEKSELGTTKNVHCAGNLFFGGQFARGDIPLFLEQEITRVITLRTDGEIDWDEQQAIEAVEIEFIKIPFRSPESLTDDVFDQVRELLKDQTRKTLFHCGSANRVGGVWLPYRVLDEGVDLETALEEAREIGLRTEFIEEKALDYIQRKQKAAANPDRVSVKPGINNSFTDPGLDVDSFVRRFEIESREVYTCRERILAACEIGKGHVVADVGAGTGLFSRLFSVEVGDSGWVYAVDISPRFLEHINLEATRLGLDNITSVLCAADGVRLPPDSVDLVFICDTYHHFEYPDSTMRSIRRALKSDGRLVVIDFERIPGQTREWLLNHVRAGKETFRSEIEESGFDCIDELEIPGFTENYFLTFRKN